MFALLVGNRPLQCNVFVKEMGEVGSESESDSDSDSDSDKEPRRIDKMHAVPL